MHDHKKSFHGIAALLAIALIIYIGALTRNAFTEHNYIGRSEEQLHTITLSGEGKVTAVPDIAQVSLGLETQNLVVATAQKENTEKMNKVIDNLKKLDIKKEDIKTENYNIYPRHDYNQGRQILRGYVVTQNINIKIRDLDKVGAVLELAGSSGANQVSGLSFTIDDPEQLRQEAREQALEKAKIKAESLAKVAGVKLGRLVSFNENSVNSPQPYFKTMEAGFGGAADSAMMPGIEPGSQDITVYVNVTYEVL